jgi:PAS domain S-box-containing protein
MTPTSHSDLNNWIKEQLFDAVPMGIAVIDREFDVIHANRAFREMFGSWKNRKCYDVYKDRESICPYCKGANAFKDGVPRVSQEVGYNRNGRLTRYIKHTVPVTDETGDIPFLVEMITDITEAEQIRAEHQVLFDHVPCHITIVDKNMRIVRGNRKLRETFGDLNGKHCFEALKGLEGECSECTAKKTFEDGKTYSGHHRWKTGDGETMHSLVTTVPLEQADGKIDLVMEMAVDITQELKLEDELKEAATTMEEFISSSRDGIFAVDEEGAVNIFNSAARDLFCAPADLKVSRERLDQMLPDGFLDKVANSSDHVFLPETEIKTFEDETLPVRLIGIPLLVDGRHIGMAFSVQDLRERKRLERDKLEAERLAAVGQTVAGLAHGVKNLITGLEGGMYMLTTGMNKSKIERIKDGMEALERNIERISVFVKAFLSFSKGREIRVEMSDPAMVAKEVVTLYSHKAQEAGIELINEHLGEIAPAPMDHNGMHECLTNLVGNAIDACLMSEDEDKRHVWVRTFEENGSIIYEVVDDGCGMDYEVKRKVFTSFFTTKGLGGTGLGLLTTKKIVQEHGGKIDLETEEGEGTTFRISLPREHLPKIIEEEEEAEPAA